MAKSKIARVYGSLDNGSCVYNFHRRTRPIRYLYQNDQENKRNNLVPYLTRFEPLGEIAIFSTYLRAGRGSEPVRPRGPKTSPKVRVIYGATSNGPNPKLMMTLKKLASPLKKLYLL